MKGLVVALIGVLGVALVNLIISDIDRCLPAIAVWMVRWNGARLPPGLSERMEEEWVAEVDATISHLRKLLFAVGLFIGRTDLLQAHGEKKAPRINGDVNVTLNGVSAVGSVGTVLLAEPAHIVISVPAATLRIGDHVAASIVEAVGSASGAHIASTARLYPPSISIGPTSGKKD